jgi:multidrug efflux pump subunit AcrA (membrane-fusion protein)
MNEKKADKRKDTIKNIAIAFLAIMLVLTFFSNTIMNYSLPEVATQAVQSGSISPQIRGTGTVSADDPYNVTVSETRKIASVAVKVGDEVKKGAVIYSLEDQESTELTDAQDNLEKLQLAYEQALLSGDINDSVITKVRSGNTDSLDAYQKKLREINDQYVSATKDDAIAQAKLDLIKYEQAYAQALISGGTGSSTASSGASSSAGTASSGAGYNAESAADITYELTKIKTNTTNTNTTITDLTSQISTLEGKLKDLDSLRSTRNTAEAAVQSAKAALDSATGSNKSTLQADYDEAVQAAKDAETIFEAALSSNNDYTMSFS